MASEFDQEREDPGTSNVSGDAAATKLFMTIKSMSRVAYARNLRLRDEDIIVAIDGVLNDDDIISFNARFDQLLENQEKLLLTICRNEVIYDVLVEDKLGVELGFADSEASAIAQKLFAQHHLGLKEHYQNFLEVLRYRKDQLKNTHGPYQSQDHALMVIILFDKWVNFLNIILWQPMLLQA